ncbi:MAG: hypothetical protein WBW33_27385, partial [Bryobacteraceae bacterium]
LDVSGAREDLLKCSKLAARRVVPDAESEASLGKITKLSVGPTHESSEASHQRTALGPIKATGPTSVLNLAAIS